MTAALSSSAFSWKPIYRELAEKVLQFRDKQSDLIALLRTLAQRDLMVIKLEDEFADGSRGEIQEIDPFTFFSAFNHGMRDDNRVAILKALKEHWALTSPLPKDFDGIPIMTSLAAWMVRYAKARRPDDVPARWRLAEAAFQAKSSDDFDPALIDACLNPKKSNLTSLTMGMFWFNPGVFLAYDKKNKDYVGRLRIPETSELDVEEESGTYYLRWVELVREHYGSDFPSFSLAAHREFGSPDDDEDTPEAKAPPARQAWALAADKNGKMWSDFYANGYGGIGWGALGDLTAYPNRKSIEAGLQKHWPSKSKKSNDSLACLKFSREISIGDIVVAKSGVDTVYGVGIVTGNYTYDPAPPDFRHRLSVKWLKSGKWRAPDRPFARKTLTNITAKKPFFTWLEKTLRVDLSNSASPAPTPVAVEPYSKADAAAELFIPADDIEHLLALLSRKKNLILQGPPGVGKTFVAERIAYAFIGARDPVRVQRVQFHPSYGYEDFIQGIRPRNDGAFQLQDGVFLKFCETAAKDQQRPYVFLIDEINRGNLSKILGEAMMLIEADKRGTDLPLMYSPERRFSIPRNVFVIGTMNTADRSISIVDYALRRRFAFDDLKPAFTTDAFAAHLTKCNRPAALIDRIRVRIDELNKEIVADTRNLGIGYEIGHSYFCGIDEADNELWYADVITYEIQPLLREYWIDQPDRWKKAVEKLRLK